MQTFQILHLSDHPISFPVLLTHSLFVLISNFVPRIPRLSRSCRNDPMPIKLRVDSEPMAPRTFMTNLNMMEAMKLGAR